MEVGLFDWLFLSKNPAQLDDERLDSLNPQSKKVIPEAYAVPSLQNAEAEDRFQIERLGCFIVDKDSTSEKLISYRNGTLWDSYNKGTALGEGDEGILVIGEGMVEFMVEEEEGK